MIRDFIKEVKMRWEESGGAVFWGLILFLAALLIAGIFRLSVVWEEKKPILFSGGEEGVISSDNLMQRYIEASGLPGLVAASINGKRYYYPWCGGINRIKQKNLVWYKTEQQAEAAGYTIARGCEEL